MSSFDPKKASDWWAVAAGLTIISMFPTAIVWVWVVQAWVFKVLATQAMVAAFCWFAHSVTEDD